MAWPHGKEGHRTHDILDFLGATGIWECWRAQKDLCPPRAQIACRERKEGPRWLLTLLLRSGGR